MAEHKPTEFVFTFNDEPQLPGAEPDAAAEGDPGAFDDWSVAYLEEEQRAAALAPQPAPQGADAQVSLPPVPFASRDYPPPVVPATPPPLPAAYLPYPNNLAQTRGKGAPLGF